MSADNEPYVKLMASAAIPGLSTHPTPTGDRLQLTDAEVRRFCVGGVVTRELVKNARREDAA